MLGATKEKLTLRFPDVHDEAVGTISFHRTLRIPDDNNEYPLPAGIGRFPIFHTEDYAETLPANWAGHGGVFLPMYQCEALWISFLGRYPMAIKVAAGKIDAVSGDGWSEDLCVKPQNYVVLSYQPWLDGFNVGDGLIRQFVAMPLGSGFTAEEQVTGRAEHGGIQLLVRPMQAEVYEERIRRPRIEAARRREQEARRREQEARRREEMAQRDEFLKDHPVLYCYGNSMKRMDSELGLAPGGLMRQKIHKDHYGRDAWDSTTRIRCFVHLLNSEFFSAVTGRPAPTTPITPLEYAIAGVPWFEHYAEHGDDVAAAKVLAGLDSIAARKIKLGHGPMINNESIMTAAKKYPHLLGQRVCDGDY